MAGGAIPRDGFLSALRPSTLNTLSLMLNPTKILMSDDGHLRDWRGLAELSGCDMLTVQNLQKNSDPFMALVRTNLRTMTVNEVIRFLEKIDRFDVIDDVKPLIEHDLSMMEERVASGSGLLRNGELSTVVNNSVMEYDAFLLYAKEDQDFVNEVIEKLEGEYNLKLCLKDRDLLAGLPFEHKGVTDIITNHCRFVLPIISPNFLNSEENKFFISFTEALGIEKGCRKIVPCVYQQCDLPKSLSYYSRLDYTKRSPYWNFWEKMRKSLENSSPIEIEKMDDKIQNERRYSASLTKSVSSGSMSMKKMSEPSSVFYVDKEIEPPKTVNETTHWIKKIIKKPKKKQEKQKIKATAS